MKIYLIKNSDYHQWLVCAENAEEAKALIPVRLLEPFKIGYPFMGQPSEPYSKVTVEEIQLDTAKVLLASLREQVWI